MITKSDFAMIISILALAVATVVCGLLLQDGKKEYLHIGNGIQATSDIEHGVVCYKTLFNLQCVQVYPAGEDE